MCTASPSVVNSSDKSGSGFQLGFKYVGLPQRQTLRAVAGGTVNTGFTFRRNQAFLRPFGDIRGKMEEEVVAPGQRNPVGVKNGSSEVKVCHEALGALLGKRLIRKAYFAFLGYNPIPCPEVIMSKLAWCKQFNGLTLEQLGAQMGRDPEQLADWLTGQHKPCRQNQEKIGHFLSAHDQGPAGDRVIGTNRGDWHVANR